MTVKRDSELGTLHYKGSTKEGPPPKADHIHEYVMPSSEVWLEDGLGRRWKDRLRLKPYCIHCGYIRKRFSTVKEAIEIDVSPKEFLKLREAQLAQ